LAYKNVEFIQSLNDGAGYATDKNVGGNRLSRREFVVKPKQESALEV